MRRAAAIAELLPSIWELRVGLSQGFVNLNFEAASIPSGTQPGLGQGDFTQWFSANSFGGTGYSNTPVGAVSNVEEPQEIGVNDAAIYFGLWQAGKNFAICAWRSRLTTYFQAIGDPLITK
jgi:hypothetical protein